MKLTDPAQIVDVLPQVTADLAARARRGGMGRFLEQVAGCGGCARPVRITGYTRRTTGDGHPDEVYSSADEPDGVTYVRCKTRRAALCPACSAEYKGDAWHLLAAGTAGGMKDVPPAVAEHPMVFVTLTAPSFGPVHTTRDDPGRGKSRGRARCRPRRDHPLCEHGRPAWCDRIHSDDDPVLGEPLCVDCYDYGAHVAFDYWAPELWRRFTIALPRVLAANAGISEAALKRLVRVQFCKCAEFQRRGVVHFHAVIRADAPAPRGAEMGRFAPPLLLLTSEGLADAALTAAAQVSYETPPWTPGAPVFELRFGDQADARPVHGAANREYAGRELHPDMVAAYLAKYATKAAEDFGLSSRLDRRPAGADAELTAAGLREHVRRIVRTAAHIAADAADVLAQDADDPAGDDAEAWVPLARWLHMLGFRGHFVTKSRRFSTTFGRLRRERIVHRRRQARQAADPGPIDLEDRADDETTVVLRSWRFQGMGWLSIGDAALAAQSAAAARERREGAADARRDHAA